MEARDIEILGIRGLGGEATSVGVDQMAERARNLGFPCTVINQEYATRIGFEHLEHSLKDKVIFGYSMGATDAIDLAKMLVEAGHKVPFLYTLDPHARRSQVDKVDLHINVWQRRNIFIVKDFYPVTKIPGSAGALHNMLAKDVASHGDLDNTQWVQDLFFETLNKITRVSEPSVPTLHSDKYDSLIDTLDDAWSRYMDPDLETDAQRKWQEAFFGVIRKEFGGLSEAAVDGMKSIIFCHRTYWSDSPIAYLAWFLGNIRREVGPNMQPIKETQKQTEANISDAQVVARLNNWWKSGRAKKAGVRSKYWLETNRYPFGRGLFQTTWHDNYFETREVVQDITGVDIPFDEDYNLMLDPLASAIGAFAMCLKGKYTGATLVSFLGSDGSFDHRNARRVVNGDTHNYDKVKGYCVKFEKAIKAAEEAVPGWLSNTIEIPANEPVSLPSKPIIVPAEDIVVTGQFGRDLSNVSGEALINLMMAAAAEFARREGITIEPSLKTIDLNDASGIRATAKVDADERPSTTKEEDPLMKILDALPLNGSKTVLGFLGIALIAAMEGPGQFPVPDYVEQWVWAWTGVAGAHKVEKLSRFYRDFIDNK